MKFEHLIQVNDPGNPLVVTMTREQLWVGLMQRVHAPERFPVGPERSSVIPGAADNEVHRQVWFGALVIEDTVTFTPQERIIFTPKPREDMPAIRLTVSIENQPASNPDALFVRFLYETDVDDPETDSYRQQAWLANDRDLLKVIRQWHAEDVL